MGKTPEIPAGNRRRLPNAALLALLAVLVLGCGTQDRYEIGAPAGPRAMVSVPGPAVDFLPTPLGDGSRTDLVAVVGDDVWYGTGDGDLVRVRDGRWFPVPGFGPGPWRGVAADGQGGLWCLDRTGILGHFVDGAWVHTENTHMSWPDGMVVDRVGRVVIWEDPGQIVRQGDDGWEDLGVPMTGGPFAVAAGDGPELVAVGWPLVNCRFDGAVWACDSLPGYTWGVAEMVAHADGRVAMATQDDDLWLLDGGGWTGHPLTSSRTVRELWWEGDRLDCLLGNPDGLGFWTGHYWGETLRLPDPPASARRAFPRPGGVWLVDGAYGVQAVAGDVVTEIAPGLGSLRDAVVDGDGRLLLATGGGLVLELDGESWRQWCRLENGIELMVVDDRGEIIVFAGGALHRLGPAGAEHLADFGTLRQSFRQRDGSLVLLDHDLGLHRWRRGELVAEAELPPEWWDIDGIVWTDTRRLILAGDRLGRWDDGGITTVLHLPNDYSCRLADGADQGTAIFGDNYCLLVQGDDFREITPHEAGRTAPVRVALQDMVAAGSGGWLALAEDSYLVRYDGEAWTRLVPPGTTAYLPESARFSRQPDGRLMIVTRASVASLDPAGGP